MKTSVQAPVVIFHPPTNHAPNCGCAVCGSWDEDSDPFFDL